MVTRRVQPDRVDRCRLEHSSTQRRRYFARALLKGGEAGTREGVDLTRRRGEKHGQAGRKEQDSPLSWAARGGGENPREKTPPIPARTRAGRRTQRVPRLPHQVC